MTQSAITDYSEKAQKTHVEIFMDEREAIEILLELKKLEAVVHKKMLDVGDFILSERVVVERKTRNDFEASIIDGRLFEQAQRLTEAFERVILIIEGDRFEERVNKSALLGAIASLISDYGVSIFFTKDYERTSELLFAIAKREQLSLGREVRLVSKKKALTLEHRQQMIIESFPSIGPKLAKSLLKHFGSIEKVIQAGERELQEVEKLGPKKAKLIRQIITSAYNEH